MKKKERRFVLPSMGRIRIIFYSGLLVTVMAVTAYFYFFKNSPPETPPYIDSLEECVRVGHPALETYPGRCLMPDGEVFMD